MTFSFHPNIFMLKLQHLFLFSFKRRPAYLRNNRARAKVCIRCGASGVVWIILARLYESTESY